MSRKTRELIDAGVATPGQIATLIRNRRIVPPQKDCSGDYVWSETDVTRLQEALRESQTRRRRAGRQLVGSGASSLQNAG